MTPTVEPEIQSLIPPLTPEESRQLEENLAQDGCLDPLVVWKERGVLIDGHNRLRICQEQDIPYRTAEVELPDLAAAKEWVIRHQFGRRNLQPYQRAELALALEPLLAAQAKENQRAGGGSGISGRQNSDKPRDTKREVAKIAGLSHDTIARVKYLQHRASKSAKEQLGRGEVSINSAYQQEKRVAVQAKREARRQKNRETIDAAPDLVTTLADARFATIVIDPPWDYRNGDLYGRGRPEYATMPLDDLAAYPIAERADEDCHLYLWVPNLLLRDGFTLLDAWGFRHTGCLTWCKPHIGMGQYFRGSTEQVLFGVKGSQPLKRKDVGTWFQAPSGPKGHSSKPVEFYDLVESCSPGPYLEVFARGERSGWTTWGGEL